MARISIDPERCKACALCIEFCPHGNIALSAEINQRGFHPAQPLGKEECSACLRCALMCPEVCIEVYK